MIISSDSCIAALGRFSVLLETWEWDSASSPPQRFTWKKSQSARGKARAKRGRKGIIWLLLPPTRYRATTEAVASIASNVVLGSWMILDQTHFRNAWRFVIVPWSDKAQPITVSMLVTPKSTLQDVQRFSLKIFKWMLTVLHLTFIQN